MILVSRKALLVFFLLSSLFLLLLGIYTYAHLIEEIGTREEVKLLAERILFFSIIGTLALIGIFTSMYIHRIRLEKKIRRLAIFGGTASPGLHLRSGELGRFGRILGDLYRRVLEINEKQTLKLSGQAELIEQLVEEAHAPLAVTDITGTILYLNDAYEKRLGETRTKLLNSSIEVHENDIIVQNILKELNKNHSFDSNKCRVFPILNSDATFSYLLFVFSPHTSLNFMKKRSGHETGS